MSQDNSYFFVQKFVKKNGHRILRIAVVNDEDTDRMYLAMHQWVVKRGLTHEWHGAGCLAVDFPPDLDEDLRHLEKMRNKKIIGIDINSLNPKINPITFHKTFTHVNSANQTSQKNPG